jgi:regulator of replication initiation timing
MLASTSKQLRDKAEEKFKKVEAGKRAMAEYQAESEARRIKTEKLRKLRLAKEAAAQTEEKQKPAPRRKAKKPSK